jgi:hypothetical protein
MVMDQNQVIETIGSITKMEYLCALNEGVKENTLVLNNVTPFPGLREKTEDGNKRLGSFFIILRYRYAPEKINRINDKLFKEKRLTRFPSYGEIITHDSILPCIRLKLVEQKEITSIQKFLIGNDLQLLPFRAFDALSRIKIFKSFKLVEIADGLYRDLSEGEKFYIHINEALNWKRFDYIIKKIKFNLENKEFDAAIGVIYRFCGPQNVVRIYDNDKSLERAIILKKWVLSEIKKEIHISTAF